jgi:hypothetical protein
MPESYTNGPSLSDLARRLQRVEDKLDERIATVDMLRASERLFEAREIAHSAATQSLETRIRALEEARTRMMQMLVTAGLALLVQGIVLIITIFGGRGGA